MECSIVWIRNLDIDERRYKRLEAFEMWVWRRITKISWTEHKTNEEVLNMVSEKRKLMETIRKRQKNWIGHILRKDSLLTTVLEGRIQGEKVHAAGTLCLHTF